MVDDWIDIFAVFAQIGREILHDALEHQQRSIELLGIGRILNLLQQRILHAFPSVREVVGGDFFDNSSIDFCNLGLLECVDECLVEILFNLIFVLIGKDFVLGDPVALNHELEMGCSGLTDGQGFLFIIG